MIKIELEVQTHNTV